MSDEQIEQPAPSEEEQRLAAIHAEAAENKKLHPSEQWFYLYEYIEGEAGPVKNSKTGQMEVGWTTPPEWKRVDGVLHTHHADMFHPDPHVRITHQRDMLASGEALTACGEKQDPRFRYIEEHDEAERCPACVAAITEAKASHEQIAAERNEKIKAELDEKIADLQAKVAGQDHA